MCEHATHFRYLYIVCVIFSHFPCEWHISIIKNECWCCDARLPTILFTVQSTLANQSLLRPYDTLWLLLLFKYAWQQIKMKFLYLTNQKRLRFIGVEKYCLVKWCVRLCVCLRLPLFEPIWYHCQLWILSSLPFDSYLCVSVFLSLSLHVRFAISFVYFSLVRNCQHARLNFRAKFGTFRLFGIHFAIWYRRARTHARAHIIAHRDTANKKIWQWINQYQKRKKKRKKFHNLIWQIKKW